MSPTRSRDPKMAGRVPKFLVWFSFLGAVLGERTGSFAEKEQVERGASWPQRPGPIRYGARRGRPTPWHQDAP